MSSASRPKILYLVTEDWFFVSHFLSVAKAAKARGYDVAAVTRIRDEGHAKTIREAGVTLISSQHERGHFGLRAMWDHVRFFRDLIRAEKPDIVHTISIRLIAIGGLAALLAGCRRRLYAITGLGLIGASTTLKARLVRKGIGLALRLPYGGRGVRYVFENPDDPRLLSLQGEAAKTLIVGGAGVDPALIDVAPMPPLPPLKMAIVARMVESKGIRVAVEAVRRARAQGANVELSLYGEPDPENPRSLSRDLLEGWTKEGNGVVWHGHTRDIPGVWKTHHVGLVPSRGGEGLPRSLLEAAAHGRCIVTTNTPGCALFTRNDVEGLVVPPGDVEALTQAFVTLAADPARVARYGEAARERIFEGFTTKAVAEKFVGLYDEMMRS